MHPLTRNDDRIVKVYQDEPAVSNDENATDQQKLYKKSEQLQHNAFELEEQQQPFVESKAMFENKKEEQNFLAVKNFLLKQQQILNIMQQSVSDLKQTTIRNKIEADVLVRDFQNKQQHDLESIHKSLLDLKQSAAGNRIKSDYLACDF